MNTPVKSNRQWRLDCEALTRQNLEQAQTIQRQDEHLAYLYAQLKRLQQKHDGTVTKEQFESECG